MTRYVAIGDSFTEGLDDRRPGGGYRGWADLVAAEPNLAAFQARCEARPAFGRALRDQMAAFETR